MVDEAPEGVREKREGTCKHDRERPSARGESGWMKIEERKKMTCGAPEGKMVS